MGGVYDPSICVEVVPLDLAETAFAGFIDICGSSHEIRIDTPDGPNSLASASLSVSPSLNQHLDAHVDILTARLHSAPSLNSFLIDFHSFSSRIVPPSPPSRPPASLAIVLSSLHHLPRDCVLTELSADMQRAQVVLQDESHRQHVVSLVFPPDFPATPCTAHTPSLPDTAQQTLASTSIPSVLEDCRSRLGEFTHVWEVLEDFDRHTHVLEPDPPSLAVLSRRISLSNHCSVTVEISRHAPRLRPLLHFFGPATLIAPIRAKLHRKGSPWDVKATPRQNLEDLMEQRFPAAPNAVDIEADAQDLGCGICYAEREGGKLPECHCDNTHCGRAFHRECLSEWLSSIPSSRHSFGAVFGECPYCSETISVQTGS